MDVDHELLTSLGFYVGLLGIKMIIMGPLTARQRFRNKAFANQEDCEGTDGKVVPAHNDVERVRRAHQNDIENIYLFVLLAAFFLTTKPSHFAALTSFRVFTAARCLHTLFYLNEMQPHRAISYMVGTAVQVYMAFRLITAFC